MGHLTSFSGILPIMLAQTYKQTLEDTGKHTDIIRYPNNLTQKHTLTSTHTHTHTHTHKQTNTYTY